MIPVTHRTEGLSKTILRNPTRYYTQEIHVFKVLPWLKTIKILFFFFQKPAVTTQVELR